MTVIRQENCKHFSDRSMTTRLVVVSTAFHLPCESLTKAGARKEVQAAWPARWDRSCEGAVESGSAGPVRAGGEDSEERRTVLQDWALKERFFAIELPADIGKRFYEGYANQALWPVFHSFPSQLRFDAVVGDAYIEANRIFCQAVVERYQPGDLVWVHDYHLLAAAPNVARRASGCGHRLFSPHSVSIQ